LDADVTRPFTTSFPSTAPEVPSAPLQLPLSDEQEFVLEAALAGESLFFTGSAGTGKSFLLRSVIRKMQQRLGKECVFVTASTGIAACNIGGTTVHSFAGIGLGQGTKEELAKKVSGDRRKAQKWKQAAVLVIDEISMLEGQLLDKLDFVARQVRGIHNVPFGGVQLIMCGDFFQLPPVGISQDPSKKFCFEANVRPAEPFLFGPFPIFTLLPCISTTLGLAQAAEAFTPARSAQGVSSAGWQFRAMFERVEVRPLRSACSQMFPSTWRKFPSFCCTH
jgi:ATP-dependent DNA helicase PIF1